MAGIMTDEALTEHLVRDLGLSKSLLVETVKELGKDSAKWDYGDIGNRINIKLDETIIQGKTKKQREDHNAKVPEQLSGKPAGLRKANANNKDQQGDSEKKEKKVKKERPKKASEMTK